MNKDCKKQLEDCHKPGIETECHRKQLKHLLISSHSVAQTEQSTIDKIVEVIKSGPYNKTLLTSGMLAVLVVAVTLNFGLRGTDNTAQANEIVHRAMSVVASLSDEDRAAIEMSLSGDLMLLLEEAYDAGDLEYMGFEEGTNMFAAHQLTTPMALNATSVAAVSGDEYYQFDHDRTPASVKLLRYTNPEGESIMFGVDEFDVPVMRYANQ